MKNIIIYLLVHLPVFSLAQGINFGAPDWLTSADCHVNAQDNALNYARAYRTPPREATVKITWSNGDDCTGTLINRNTGDNNVGFYLLTARHCTAGKDFDAEHVLYFNYQSPNNNTNATPFSNHGMQQWQTGDKPPFSLFSTVEGYEYQHVTRLSLVEDYAWSDFALLEILTPIPPHFNISYAGWNPSMFHNGFQIGNTAPSFFDPFIGIHHPKGDIKKISTLSEVFWNENPVATACYTITTIIDIAFGWIWGHRTSTQVICHWMDNPYLTVLAWEHGITEPGSSGSGIFNRNNNWHC